MKVVTAAEMRELERRAAERGIPSPVLMEHAGLAVALEVKRWLGGAAGRQVIVLVGPGNNGGDGLVAARHLHDWGARVHVCLCSEREGDANYDIVRARAIPCTFVGAEGGLAALGGLLAAGDVVIDSLFGTGRLRPLEGVLREVLVKVREARTARPALGVVAVDVPSGLDADSGAIDPASAPADITITLGYPKVGLFAFPGRGLVGELVVADIGIPDELGADIVTGLIDEYYVNSMLPRRPLDAHKGTNGRVLICAGSGNYIGAAYLACEAALRVGAGLVTLAVARSLQPVLAAKLTEATYAPLAESEPGFIAAEAAESLHEWLATYDVLLIGCGLGQHPSVASFVARSLLEMPPSLDVRVIIDADALNALAQVPQWWQRMERDAVLTPHPGEMARLTALPVGGMAQGRSEVARQAAQDWHKTVVLKGAHTVVASPDGAAMISPFANPGLASAGTGDVLAGAIAGLAAQGLPPAAAAACGVYLHGAAGEVVKCELGDAGMVASDLLPVLPTVIKSIKGG